MAGIFGSLGAWWLGFDFCQENTFVPVGGIVTFNFPVNSSGVFSGAAYARYSGKGIIANDIPASITKTFGVNLTTFFGGFAYKCVNLPASGGANAFCTIYDTTGAAPKLNLTVNGQGQVQCYTGGGLTPTGGVSVSTTIGSPSATGVIVAGAYNFVEVKFTLAVTTGIIQIVVNGVTVITFNGTTTSGGNTFFNSMILGSKTNGCVNYFDDWYILDATGSAPFNTFLGNGRAQTDAPNADSSTAGLNTWAFTTPQGTDYGNCGNIPPNVAQYISATATGARASMRFPALSTSRVLGLNTWFSAEQDSAGSKSLIPVFRSSTTDQNGTSVNMTGAYVYSNQISTIDPNTGLPWSQGTVIAAQNCEIGPKVNT